MKSFVSFCLLIGFLLSPSRVHSQYGNLYYVSQKYSTYLDYLINSGRVSLTHPLSQPYKSKDIQSSFAVENEQNLTNWDRLLLKDLSIYKPADTSALNGKGFLGLGTGTQAQYYNNQFNNYFNGHVMLGYSYRNFSAFHLFEVNQIFALDEDYFGGATGKLQRPVIGRSTISYLEYNLKNLNVFAGRLPVNYGIFREKGLLLSDNTHSFDQLGFRFENKILRFSAIYARLDDIFGYDIRTETYSDSHWNKRFLSVHRLEISLSEGFKIAFSEAILYGGKTQQPLFQYLNPLNIFFLSKMSDRKGYEESNANSLGSFEVFLKPKKNITFYAQFLIDDMDFTKELREKYPDRIGIKGKIILTDILPFSQFYASYNKISNWTYNSFYTFGNYIYYGKSLGYPMHGTENFSLGADLFKLAPFSFHFQLRGERAREQNLKEAFEAEKTKFPIGIPQKSLSSNIRVHYSPSHFVKTSVSLEYVTLRNYENVNRLNKSFLNAFFAIQIDGFLEIIK